MIKDQQKLNIYLDIDDVIADWLPSFCKRYNCQIPKTWDSPDITLERLNELREDKSFWFHLPIKNRPNFRPKGFITARSIPKNWTYLFLALRKIPGRNNVHQIPWNYSKIDKLKELKCDIFIDDKAETFLECHENGIFCLLMDAPHNQEINTPYRIYDLNIKTIMRLWKKSR